MGEGRRTAGGIAADVADARPLAIWVNDDLVGHGSRAAVDKALQRLVDSGALVRPAKGIYYKPSPMRSSLTGRALFPRLDAFVEAIVRRDRARIVVDPHTAAHGLGMTTAVPARSVVTGDVSTREVHVTNPETGAVHTIEFRKASGRKLAWAGRPAMRAVQALTWYKDKVEAGQGDEVARLLTSGLLGQGTEAAAEVTADLMSDVGALPRWMAPLARSVSASVEARAHVEADTLDADHEADQPGPTP